MAYNNGPIDVFFTEKLDDSYVRLSAEQTDLGQPLLRLIDAEGRSCWALESDFDWNIWNYCLLHPGALELARQRDEVIAMEGGEEIEDGVEAEEFEAPVEGEDAEYEEDHAGEESESEDDTTAEPVTVSEKKRGKQPMTQQGVQPTPAPAIAAPTTSLSTAPPSSASLPAPSLPAPSLPALSQPQSIRITTIDLNALTPSYTGIRIIPANLLAMSQRINAQPPISRRWLHRHCSSIEFVQKGYFADKSGFWDFWMDSRLFDGPTWWHLATGNDKPYPKGHNATAPIQPGSIQQGLNRGVGWDDTRIYSAPAPVPAPAPASSSTAAAPAHANSSTSTTSTTSASTASASTASASTGTRASKRRRTG